MGRAPDVMRDEVTGLLGRRGFLAAVDEAVASGMPVAVLALGLERFDTVNAVHGRAVGDQLLRSIGTRLAGRLRGSDRAARIGGDVFGVVCRGIEEAELHEVAAALQDAVLRSRAFADVPASVRAAAGVAHVSPAADINGEEAVMRADLALHEARTIDGGAISVYPADPVAAFALGSRFTWGRRLYAALEHNALRLHAAPIIALRDRSIVGYDLDLLLSDGEGDVEGDAVRRQARAAGLGDEVDRWAVTAAVEWIARWRVEVGDAFAMVPIAASMLQDRSIIAQLNDDLGSLGVDPKQIVLALDCVDNDALISSTADSLRLIGVGLALRGFPVRGCPTPALGQLPFSVVEIDPLLTRTAPTRPAAARLVERLAAYGNAEDMLVIAAGLRSEDEVDALANLGVAAG